MPWTRSVTQYLHVVESSPIIAEALQLLQDNLVWIVFFSFAKMESVCEIEAPHITLNSGLIRR